MSRGIFCISVLPNPYYLTNIDRVDIQDLRVECDERFQGCSKAGGDLFHGVTRLDSIVRGAGGQVDDLTCINLVRVCDLWVDCENIVYGAVDASSDLAKRITFLNGVGAR